MAQEQPPPLAWPGCLSASSAPSTLPDPSLATRPLLLPPRGCFAPLPLQRPALHPTPCTAHAAESRRVPAGASPQCPPTGPGMLGAKGGCGAGSQGCPCPRKVGPRGLRGEGNREGRARELGGPGHREGKTGSPGVAAGNWSQEPRRGRGTGRAAGGGTLPTPRGTRLPPSRHREPVRRAAAASRHPAAGKLRVPPRAGPGRAGRSGRGGAGVPAGGGGGSVLGTVGRSAGRWGWGRRAGGRAGRASTARNFGV